ncbi:GNAT family N-acetyltransferase [Nocardioides sp.]|uniref:GNAT family N-acetyltransferase n=1 Tax=Nocardioides sp. TaxID=35761 RepID=UPI003512F665
MSASLLARMTLEPLVVRTDGGSAGRGDGRGLAAATLYTWLTHPRSRYWGMGGASLREVVEAYAAIAADPRHHAWLGRLDGRAVLLAETYDPAEVAALAECAELAPGDLGMHLLVAPPEGAPIRGLTRAAMDLVLAQCFSVPAVQRVVVEPDVRNTAIRALNVAAGFEEVGEIRLPDKVAMLSVLTRERWCPPALVRASSLEGTPLPRLAAVDHLAPGPMAEAQRHLVAKALGEFAHERLIAPLLQPDGRWRVDTDGSRYTFAARVHAPEHWVVDADSIVRERGDGPLAVAPDAQELIAELAPVLEIGSDLLPVYLEEIASTLASAAWKRVHSRTPVAELVDADHAAIEAAMTEGHPAFVANNGRIGFGLDDYLAYAPETGSRLRLEWLAARRSLTTLSLGKGIDEQGLYDAELGAAVRARFEGRLRGLGLDSADFLLLPVHPWQWRNRIAITFAPDLARHDLVHLGTADDEHRPQQSIRTLANATRPERHLVKTALAIQNMGFVRGLSPRYMRTTPAINDWVAGVVHEDDELRACGFEVLREVAAIGYTGDAFHRIDEPSPYRRMVAALWRESPVPRAGEGERLATMAALLHRDVDGDALITAWIKASPLDAAGWVRAYLRCYLRPIVHCLLTYDLAFMPHGENVVLRLRDHVPVGAFMKDIGEEIAVMGDLPLPAEVERVRVEVSDDLKALALHTDVVDGVLRFIAGILDDDGVLAGEEFWGIARSVIEEHAADHPELAGASARYDLLRDRFRHSCLNRLQLRNTRQMVDLADQASSLLFAGTLANPLAAGGDS